MDVWIDQGTGGMLQKPWLWTRVGTSIPVRCTVNQDALKKRALRRATDAHITSKTWKEFYEKAYDI